MPSVASQFTATLDTRAQEKWLRRYTSTNVEFALDDAAKKGAQAGAKIMKAEAPVGDSKREGQYYRRNGLKHGTFKKSIRAAKIRGRRSAITGLQGKTVGYVIGPMGKNAFTRAWIEMGTEPHDMSIRKNRLRPGLGHGMHPGEKAQHWTARAAGPALSVARSVSEARLVAYARV